MMQKMFDCKRAELVVTVEIVPDLNREVALKWSFIRTLCEVRKKLSPADGADQI